MRSLGTHLTEQAQDLCDENDTILLKDVAEILSKGRETVVMSGRCSFVKVSGFPN